MKPSAQPIDPKKRSKAPPEVVLTREIASSTMRIFLAMLVVPLMFEISAWVSLDRIVNNDRTGAPASTAVTEFAAELKRRGIPLVLVAVPERVTIYPDAMRGSKYHDAVRSAGETDRLDALRSSGIEIIDLTQTFWDLRDKDAVFFARDSHWTPDAMKKTALLVEKHIREKHPGLALDETPLISVSIRTRRDAGDLARRLDPLFPQIQLGEEQADMVAFPDVETISDSPILLMGGELIRMFDDPTLGFGGDSEAGFITQFGLLMGRSIEVVGWPAESAADLEGKKLVVLVLPMSEVLP